MGFRKAEKRQRKAKIGLFAISGGGKTKSALRMAQGMIEQMLKDGQPVGNGIAMIETEHGSAELYAGDHDFDIDRLDDNRSIKAYTKSLQDAARLGYSVVIVDSLSHAWQELLAFVDRQKTRNDIQAWAKATPQQREFIDALLKAPFHLICTMRQGTEWSMEKDDNGRIKPKRVGVKPEQGKGIEYEFDCLFLINEYHQAQCLKDRTSMGYQDRIVDKLSENDGAAIVGWLNDAKPEVEAEPQAEPEQDRPEPKGNRQGSVRSGSNNKPSSMQLILQYANAIDSCETLADLDVAATSWGERLKVVLEKNPKMNGYVDAYYNHALQRLGAEVPIKDEDKKYLDAIETMRKALRKG